jgi:hypothetical protein
MEHINNGSVLMILTQWAKIEIHKVSIGTGLDADKEIGLEVNAEKTRRTSMFMSCYGIAYKILVGKTEGKKSRG